MIIGDKFIFLHVPKCAGSSFCKMMLERHGLKETQEPHSSARDIPKELRKTHFIFGFMRNPLKAEASNYYYHTASWGRDFDNSMGFERWCEWRFTDKPRDWSSPWIKQSDLRQYGHDFSALPSAGFFCDEDGECIADHIFRFEDMPLATEALTDILGMDCDINKFRELISAGRPEPRAVITPRSAELVNKSKSIDARLHGAPGRISTDFHCPTVPDYAYSRKGLRFSQP